MIKFIQFKTMSNDDRTNILQDDVDKFKNAINKYFLDDKLDDYTITIYIYINDKITTPQKEMSKLTTQLA